MKMIAIAAGMVLAAGASNASILRYDLTNPLLDMRLERQGFEDLEPTTVETGFQFGPYNFFIEIDTNNVPFDLRFNTISFWRSGGFSSGTPGITNTTEQDGYLDGTMAFDENYNVSSWYIEADDDSPNLIWTTSFNQYYDEVEGTDANYFYRGNSGPGVWAVSDVTPVPVPASLPLMLTSIIGFLLYRRARRYSTVA